VVSKTACPSPVVPGGVLTYTITATNDGNAVSADATLVDVLPAGVTLVDAGGGTVSEDPTTVTWDLGPLEVGQVETRTIKVLVEVTTGTLHNTITLSAEGVADATSTVSTPVSNAGAITHGSAYGADVRLLGGIPVLGINQFGEVATVAPPSPDADLSELTNLGVPGAVNISLLRQTSTSNVELEAVSTATSTVVGLNLLNGLLTADVVKAVSQSVAGPTYASYNFTGSTFTNLKVNGKSLTNVKPNTTVDLKLLGITVARAVLLEQSGASSMSGPNSASGTLNMVHVTLLAPIGTLPAGAQIIVAHAQSDATYPTGLACGTQPSTVSGEAFSAFVQGSLFGESVLVAKQGDAVLPPTGGSMSDQVNDLDVDGVLWQSTASNTTSGSLDPKPNSTARSRVTGLSLLDGLITADVLDVASTSVSTGPSPSTSFTTTFLNLRVAGIPVVAPVGPNTTIAIPQPDGGILLVVLNEQVTASTAKDSEGTVNAIHVFLLRGSAIELEVIVASAHSDVHLA